MSRHISKVYQIHILPFLHRRRDEMVQILHCERWTLGRSTSLRLSFKLGSYLSPSRRWKQPKPYVRDLPSEESDDMAENTKKPQLEENCACAISDSVRSNADYIHCYLDSSDFWHICLETLQTDLLQPCLLNTYLWQCLSMCAPNVSISPPCSCAN